jgi:hypothetical protein
MKPLTVAHPTPVRSAWFPVDGPALATAFKAYPTLEKIAIDEILIGEDSTAEEFASAFAVECPLLKEVAFLPEPEDSDSDILNILIQRSTSESGVGEACAGEWFYSTLVEVDSD